MRYRITKTILTVVAKELNELLGGDPPININLKLADLQAEVIEASELLEKGDAISDVAMVLFEKLKLDLPDGLVMKPITSTTPLENQKSQKKEEAEAEELPEEELPEDSDKEDSDEEEQEPELKEETKEIKQAPKMKKFLSEKYFSNPNKTTRAMMLVVDNPDLTNKEYMAKLEEQGVTIAMVTLEMIALDTRKVLGYLALKEV